MSESSPLPPQPFRTGTPRRRRSRWFVLLLVLLVIGGVITDGAVKHPTGAAEGTALNGAATQPAHPGLIRVGTFNIDGGVGLDGKRDLTRAAALFKGFELVALNEVHGGGISGGADQAQLLGQMVGLPWLFAPVERRWWRDDFGNAVLTSLAVTQWQRLPIAGSTASSNRNVLLLRVKIGIRPVTVLIAHVERGHDHDSQLRAVLGLFLTLAEPAMLLGDLNTIDDDPQLKLFLQTPGVTDVIGQTVPKPGKHVDWIFLRGLHTIGGGMQPRGVSDHPFFWADVLTDRK